LAILSPISLLPIGAFSPNKNIEKLGEKKEKWKTNRVRKKR